MKRIKYVLLIILLLITFNVKAEDRCDSKEYARLKELAKKVEFDYDYKIVDGKAVFSINAVNLNKDLKVIIIEDYYNEIYKEFKDNSTHMATVNGFSEGEKVVVTLKGYVANWCSGKTLLTKTIRLPYYNTNYSEEKCKGHEDFKYCKLLVDKKITLEEFNRQYEAYLKGEGEKDKPTDDKTKDNTKLYMIIGGVVLLIAIITVVVMQIIKRRKKNQL